MDLTSPYLRSLGVAYSFNLTWVQLPQNPENVIGIPQKWMTSLSIFLMVILLSYPWRVLLHCVTSLLYINLFPNKILLVDFISFYILFYLLFLTTKFMSHFFFYWTMKSLRWENFLSGIYFQLLLKYENIKKLPIKILKYSVN